MKYHKSKQMTCTHLARCLPPQHWTVHGTPCNHMQISRVHREPVWPSSSNSNTKVCQSTAYKSKANSKLFPFLNTHPNAKQAIKSAFVWGGMFITRWQPLDLRCDVANHRNDRCINPNLPRQPVVDLLLPPSWSSGRTFWHQSCRHPKGLHYRSLQPTNWAKRIFKKRKPRQASHDESTTNCYWSGCDVASQKYWDVLTLLLHTLNHLAPDS